MIRHMPPPITLVGPIVSALHSADDLLWRRCGQAPGTAEDNKRMSINYGLVGSPIIPYILPLDSSLMMMFAAKQNDPAWIDQQSRIPFYNKFQALAEVFRNEINLVVIFCSSASTARGSIYLYKSKSSPILSTRKKADQSAWFPAVRYEPSRSVRQSIPDVTDRQAETATNQHSTEAGHGGKNRYQTQRCR